MTVLIDTNVLSELARPRPAPAVARWAARLDAAAVSVITVDEVFYGLTVKPRPQILGWFERFFDGECRVLDVTGPIARHAGLLRGQLAAKGRPRTQADMLIAATAAIHGLSVATRNTRDFTGCGVSVVDPFE